MKHPGEQPQAQMQDDTDPQQFRGSKRKLALKIGAAVTASALAVSIGAGGRELAEPRTVHGTAEVSADALKDPMIYLQSAERNKPLTKTVNQFTDRIVKDMNDHPERTEFKEDSPTEDNDDNVTGHGGFVETVKADDGSTYRFTMLASQHGAVVDGGEVVMSRSTMENGHPIETAVTFAQDPDQEVWNTQISVTNGPLNRLGPVVSVNQSVAERPEQTGQTLHERDNQAIMQARQYLEAAGITE